MALPFLYFAGDRLSEPELCAARLDGHLVELGEGYVPADVVETRELRAASLAPLLGDTLAATHATAAWVHGALVPAPGVHHVRRAAARRISAVIDGRVRYRDARIEPADVEVIAGVRISSPGRTLVDLARSGSPADLAVARALVAAVPASRDDALAWLAAAGPVHDKRAALRVIRELPADQEEVTR
jgi:hypothetical protein